MSYSEFVQANKEKFAASSTVGFKPYDLKASALPTEIQKQHSQFSSCSSNERLGNISLCKVHNHQVRTPHKNVNFYSIVFPFCLAGEV